MVPWWRRVWTSERRDYLRIELAVAQRIPSFRGAQNRLVFSQRKEIITMMEWFNFIPRGVIVGICLNRLLGCLFLFLHLPEKLREGLNCLIHAVQVFSREGRHVFQRHGGYQRHWLFGCCSRFCRRTNLQPVK